MHSMHVFKWNVNITKFKATQLPVSACCWSQRIAIRDSQSVLITKSTIQHVK